VVSWELEPNGKKRYYFPVHTTFIPHWRVVGGCGSKRGMMMLNVPPNDIRPTWPRNHPDARTSWCNTHTHKVHNKQTTRFLPLSKLVLEYCACYGRAVCIVLCALFWGQEKAQFDDFSRQKLTDGTKTLPRALWQFATFNICGWNFLYQLFLTKSSIWSTTGRGFSVFRTNSSSTSTGENRQH
jgi:hypothetical protein